MSYLECSTEVLDGGSRDFLKYPQPTLWADGRVVAKITRPTTGRADAASLGAISKTYKWDKTARLVVRSKCASMWWEAKRRKYQTWFITLTARDYVETNECVSNFIENLKKRGIISQFVWVRERQKRGANHWHILFTSKFKLMDYALVRKAWNSALDNLGYEPSPNSVRFGKNPRVYEFKRVVNYICKYMSKANTIKLPARLDDKNEYVECIRLTHSSRIKYKVNVNVADLFEQKIEWSWAVRNEAVMMYGFDNTMEDFEHLYRAMLEASEYYKKLFNNLNFN